MHFSRFLILVFFSGLNTLLGQSYSIQTKTNLSDTISETSGLICIKGRLFSHNDSGNEPIIYEIDTTNGCILNLYPISGAVNVDWEDITCDDSFLYIGDFGNNNGTRKDLCIYKIGINRILKNDTNLKPEKINFSFSNQTSFSSQPYTTNFDVEALASIDNQLIVFTKNWGNNRCDIYTCPKTPGTFNLTKIDSFNSQGMITGADYSANDSLLALCGYTLDHPFVYIVKRISPIGFNWQSAYKIDLVSQKQIQMEGIAFEKSGSCFVSNEKFSSSAKLQKLNFSLKAKSNVSQIYKTTRVFPNPCEGQFMITSDDKMKNVSVYTLMGQKVSEMDVDNFELLFSMENLQNGIYHLHILYEDGKYWDLNVLKN
jgi:hypothetical protein